jgi:hypothetical protein
LQTEMAGREIGQISLSDVLVLVEEVSPGDAA